MQSGIVVDLTPFLQGAGGVGSRQFSSRLPRVQEAMRWLSAAGQPWFQRNPAQGADGAAMAVLTKAKRLRVVGQPGAISAIQAILTALAPTAAITWQMAPDSTAVPSGCALVCLEGPDWVDQVAEDAAKAGRQVVMVGDGAHEAPPGGAWLSDSAGGDGRFCWLGTTVPTLLKWAGVDDAAWTRGIAEGQGVCARPALFENPAWALANSLSMLPDSVPVLVATRPELGQFMRSIARCWGAQVRGAPARGALSARVGLVAVDGIAGDEELFEAVHGGPRDRLPIFWGPNSSAAETFQWWLGREARPWLALRTASINAEDMARMAATAVHAGVAFAALQQLDPVAAPGVEAWLAASRRTSGSEA